MNSDAAGDVVAVIVIIVIGIVRWVVIESWSGGGHEGQEHNHDEMRKFFECSEAALDEPGFQEIGI